MLELTTRILLTLGGVVIGILASLLFICFFLKIKCPQCKTLKPLREVARLNGLEVIGQFCQECQREKTKSPFYSGWENIKERVRNSLVLQQDKKKVKTKQISK